MSVTGTMKNCPCGNVGWYVVANRNTGDPEQEQCEFCYTEPDSVFNVVTRLECRVSKLEEALRHIVTVWNSIEAHYAAGEMAEIATRALEDK